ncbi:MAG TPA: hypothetical protein VE224_16275 [Pseudolabrys sp.]|jgi:hypothetical protein|nr:hypothetical protein [Pseudolabrys sp.]
MKKSLTAVAVAGALALASVAMPQPAQARHGHVAAGIIGGLAAGALLGAAVANGPYYYGPGYYYGPPGPYYYRPHCWLEHERYWNGWTWRWHRVRVCD